MFSALRHFRSVFRLLGVAALLAGVAESRTIRWFSDPLQTNLTSSNVPLDGDFRFEIGVFTNGFVPTSGNTMTWAANWVPAQRVLYGAANQFFSGDYKVNSNAAPFTVGAKAYVWGFGGRSGNEWILFSAPTWTWPQSNLTDPNALSWTVAAATQVIVGSTNASGSPYLMRTASVIGAPPSTSWAQWRSEMLDGVVLNGANDDPDRDGVSNALEFAFGTLPMVADAPSTAVSSLTDVSGQKYLQLSVPRRIDRTATILVQISSDLTIWNSGAGFTETVSNGYQALVVRASQPVSPSVPKQFMRVRVTVP